MTDHDDHGACNSPSETELFSSSEIEALKLDLTAIQDTIGAIRAFERSCAGIEPAWKRKSAVVEKLQKENRRVLECSAIFDELRRWRELRARTKAEREARETETVT